MIRLPGCAATLAALFMPNNPAMAGTTGGLALRAHVPARYAVRLDRERRANLGLSSTSAKDIEVGRIVEFNNSSGLFSVRIFSQSAGFLKASGNATGASIRYELSYDGAPVDLSQRAATQVSSEYRAPGTTSLHVIKIKLPEHHADSRRSSQPPMKDTLTFSVTAD